MICESAEGRILALTHKFESVMNEQNKQYQQLTQGLRYQIFAYRNTGMTLRKIAHQVGVHFSTVSRELRRNLTLIGYDPEMAQKLSDIRKKTSQKANKRNERTDKIIAEHIRTGWSPETISVLSPTMQK